MDAINNGLAHASFGAVFFTGWIALGALAFVVTGFIAYLINTPRPAHWLPPIGPGYRPRYVAARTWRPILIRAAIGAASMMFLLVPLIMLLAFGGVANNSNRQLSTTGRR